MAIQLDTRPLPLTLTITATLIGLLLTIGAARGRRLNGDKARRNVRIAWVVVAGGCYALAVLILVAGLMRGDGLGIRNE